MHARYSAGIAGRRFDLFAGKPASEDKPFGDSMFNEDSFEEWIEVFKTKTAGPYFVTMAFLSLLEKGARAREGQTSSVVNISSVNGSYMKVTGGVVSRKGWVLCGQHDSHVKTVCFSRLPTQ
jgi:NAD(P)-dependent dehydrogenase (short-subunit alcohol dehydrogenase family)